ncbi:MAG: DUF4136 domain-containing protein [Gammaproteobacteria bacterium]|nr:MAG: DUF4136 domain-containing protein [Gammaproteobacteria bacterium]
MFNRALTATATVMLALIIAGCSSSGGIESTYDYNREVDFRAYKTYAFISENPMAVSQAQGAVNPMLQGRIMESIRVTMNGKGYNEVSNVEAADMAIGFTVGSRDQIKVDTYPSSFHGGYSRRGYYYGYNYGTETRVRQYTEGQLAVDIFDVASKNPAFHGVASKKITDSDRENQQQTLNAITAEALAGFPLSGGSVVPQQ